MDITGVKLDLFDALDNIMNGNKKIHKITSDYAIKVYRCGSIIRCDIKLADESHLDEELPF